MQTLSIITYSLDSQSEFILLQVNPFQGKATLLSDLAMQKKIGKERLETSYFEKLINRLGKNQPFNITIETTSLFYKIVDQTEAVEENNCFPDISP
ncbi:hypothetical protein [Pajaroellobacter abortibovis]|uniref:Uncharacterized protein n=1 Tax=Pajaroellobacter abortibovis TaxID=1882918 RepID=A0A1L6MW63_9BACT|nr:hypothetical protein [Pajaroellobacter abortibovis]APR99772.1 hypothetical protein BCY86_03080 [Pajaroellobacter abortibovis]